MKYLYITLVIFSIMNPVFAQSGVDAQAAESLAGGNAAMIQSSIDYQTYMNTPYYPRVKKEKKHTAKFLPSGNIVVDGKEYAPISANPERIKP